MRYYLAIDIGASGGRHILGWYENDRLHTVEVYRFDNGMVKRNDSLCWDYDALFAEILKGLKTCGDLGKVPYSLAIDTWGVDFVLLDESGNVLGDTIAYRDNRTEGMDKAVFKLISQEDLYSRTGIANNIFNTIFQLVAVDLDKANSMLMVPDYLNYMLTGIAKTEYTEASTSGLLNAKNRNWDDEIISKCGFPRHIFGEIVPPGTFVAELRPEVANKLGFETKIIAAASHDTASAVMAVPSANSVYISSGTWSLMGIEIDKPNCSLEAFAGGFTNEGGYKRYRFLKNIMGLWMIQSVRAEMGKKYSYAQLCQMAEMENIASIVDCNHKRFFAPENMTKEIQLACSESNQAIPQTPGELAAVIYNSLAACYRDSVADLEKISGRTFETINIVGGGANASYLNRLTAEYTGKTVYAGPIEATAIGNLLVQMIADGVFRDLQEARECVMESFEIEIVGGVEG